MDELIPENHMVRPVSEMTDQMGIERLLRKRQAGGGASRHHPVMMSEVFVYGYMTKVCSSRMPAKAVGESVMFMRLAGGQGTGFRTLDEFRGKPLAGVMEEIIVGAVEMPAGKGRVKLERHFEDGTTIESAAGRHTFVWKKSVEKNDRKLDEKPRAHIRLADKAWEDEQKE